MAHASLLLQLQIPENDEDKRRWSERIRLQVTRLSRSIQELESQKQQLLARLCEAGEVDAEIDDPMIPDPVIVRNLSPRMSPGPPSPTGLPIVDLLSQETTPDIKHRELDTSPRSIPLESSIPELLPDNMYPSSPASPPFSTSENICPNPSHLERRVYKPEEFDLVDWSKLDVSDLKEWASFFGMKSSGGRQLILSELQKIFKYLRHELIVPGELPGLSINKESIFGRFAELLKGNSALYERVLVLESIEFDEVLGYIKTSFEENQYTIPPNFKGLVKEFLDENYIHFNTTADKVKRGKRKIDAPEDRRRRKILRKSISCP